MYTFFSSSTLMYVNGFPIEKTVSAKDAQDVRTSASTKHQPGAHDTHYLIALYVDFQKAYNKVNHFLFLEKLALIGTGRNCHKIFQSYSKNRKQTVRFQDFVSQELSGP